jgi:hypothetical protein
MQMRRKGQVEKVQAAQEASGRAKFLAGPFGVAA